MTREELGAAALALPDVTKVVQWGDSDVYKVGGKVFAICGDDVRGARRWVPWSECAMSLRKAPASPIHRRLAHFMAPMPSGARKRRPSISRAPRAHFPEAVACAEP